MPAGRSRELREPSLSDPRRVAMVQSDQGTLLRHGSKCKTTQHSQRDFQRWCGSSLEISLVPIAGCLGQRLALSLSLSLFLRFGSIFETVNAQVLEFKELHEALRCDLRE